MLASKCESLVLRHFDDAKASFKYAKDMTINYQNNDE